MNSEAVMSLSPAGNEQYGGDEPHADGGKVMGMKFSFSTLGCPDWTLEEILDFAAGNDLGVEIRGIGPNVNTADITELKPENIDETRAMIGEYGVKIVGLGTSAFFDGHMPFPDALHEVDAAAVIAERLGVSMLRIFGDQIWDERIGADILRIAGDGIRAACRLVEGTDIRLALEVHGQFNSAEQLRWLLDYVASPHFAVLWDIEHTATPDYRSFYETLKDGIIHIHLKDSTKLCNCLDGRGELVLPGDGILMRELMPFLAGCGYDGWASFEWEKRWHRTTLPGPEVAFPRFVKFIGPYR